MSALIPIILATRKIVSDTFSRPDNTSLGNAETGQAWTGTPGHSISGGRLVAGAAFSRSWVDAGLSDKLEVRAKLNLGAYTTENFTLGLMLRLSDENNFILGSIRSIGQLELHKFEGGVSTQIGVAAFPTAPSTTYELKLVARGSALSLYVDGVLRVTATSTFNQSKTRAGVRLGGNPVPGNFADDFAVSEVA